MSQRLKSKRLKLKTRVEIAVNNEEERNRRREKTRRNQARSNAVDNHSRKTLRGLFEEVFKTSWNADNGVCE